MGNNTVSCSPAWNLRSVIDPLCKTFFFFFCRGSQYTLAFCLVESGFFASGEIEVQVDCALSKVTR